MLSLHTTRAGGTRLSAWDAAQGEMCDGEEVPKTGPIATMLSSSPQVWLFGKLLTWVVLLLWLFRQGKEQGLEQTHALICGKMRKESVRASWGQHAHIHPCSCAQAGSKGLLSAA